MTIELYMIILISVVISFFISFTHYYVTFLNFYFYYYFYIDICFFKLFFFPDDLKSNVIFYITTVFPLLNKNTLILYSYIRLIVRIR